MSILESGPAIVLYHLLPGALAALIYLLLANIFIFIFRIKRPSFKFYIYLIVMYKTLLVLLSGARYSTTLVPRKSFGFGTMLYDPFDLLPIPSTESAISFLNSFKLLQSPWLASIITIVLVIIFAMFILRWFATAWFFKKLASESRPLDINISEFVEEVSLKLKIRVPNIFTSDSEVGPMSIGVTKPTIVLPQKIVDSFSVEEIKVIIGHELAHIKRRDNLFQWLSLFLKDVLFFSPFSRSAYRLLQRYKEISADGIFLRIMPDKKDLLTKTVQKVYERSEINSKSAGLMIAKASFADVDIANKRLELLKQKNERLFRNSFISLSIQFTGLLLFFWVKFWIVIKAGNKGLMLLS